MSEPEPDHEFIVAVLLATAVGAVIGWLVARAGGPG